MWREKSALICHHIHHEPRVAHNVGRRSNWCLFMTGNDSLGRWRMLQQLLVFISLNWLTLSVTSLDVPERDDSSVPASGSRMSACLISRLYDSCLGSLKDALNLTEANGAFQAFTFTLNFDGSIQWKAHDVSFVFQQGRKLRNAHLWRSASYEGTSRAEDAAEADHKAGCWEGLRSSSKCLCLWC